MRAPRNPFEHLDVKTAVIHPIAEIAFADAARYWDDLKKAGYLAFRICDVVNPGWANISYMVNTYGRNMYMVEWGGRIAAEFMLTNFSGKAAQIHFSTHPTLHIRESIPFVKHAIRSVFTWKEQGTNKPYLESLYGVTPVTNRAACIYVLKVGFKKQFILPSGMRDRGKVVDAMISTFTRNDLEGAPLGAPFEEEN